MADGPKVLFNTPSTFAIIIDPMVMEIKMTACADGAYDDHLQVYILLPKNKLFLPKDPNTKVIDPQ